MKYYCFIHQQGGNGLVFPADARGNDLVLSA